MFIVDDGWPMTAEWMDGRRMANHNISTVEVKKKKEKKKKHC